MGDETVGDETVEDETVEDETVPHPSSVFCSMGGKPQRPTIGKSPFCFLLGRNFSRAEKAQKTVEFLTPARCVLSSSHPLLDLPITAWSLLFYSAPVSRFRFRISDITRSTFQSSASEPSTTMSALAAEGRTNSRLEGRTRFSH